MNIDSLKTKFVTRVTEKRQKPKTRETNKMSDVSKEQADELIITCPMCHCCKTVKLKSIDELKSNKIMKFRCTCGNHFHKQIVRKDFKKIDIISAIARLDIEVIWYKTIRLLSLCCVNFRSERVRQV